VTQVPRRARRPGRVVAILGFVGAVPLASLWYVGHSLATRTEGRSAEPVANVLTPVLSVRRAAGTLAADVVVRNLRGELSAVTDRIPGSGCLRVDAGGRVVVSKSADKELTPASNMKIATAAVALEVLPPTTRFVTKVVGNVKDGVVEGDVVLVGGGDPLLVSREYLPTEKNPTTSPTYIDDLADAVKAAGVTTITGSVVGDESYLDDDRYIDDWSSGIRGTEGGPLGALMVNDGVVIGEPLKPDNPAVAAAAEFTRLLKARGIVVNGEPREAKGATTGETIAEISSADIAAVVAEMLTNSDNNTAELIVKEIGVATSGSGTRESGIAAITQHLVDAGFTTEGFVMTDGSGLDRDNRATCRLFMEILASDGGYGDIANGLAVLGKTGTLRDILIDSIAAGRLLAKTGTLTDVKTLSGYTRYGESLAVQFSLLLNGKGVSNQGSYRPIWNALANAMGTASDSPSAADVAP